MDSPSKSPRIHEEDKMITPEIAKALLNGNIKNRKVRPRVVEAYARDMKNGKWQYTGDAIRLDVDGNLIDGQHRLQASILANAGFYTKLIRGLPTETMLVMDAGAARSHSDHLTVQGHKYGRDKVAALRMFILVDEHYTSNRSMTATRAYTTSEILKMLDLFPEIEEDIKLCKAAYSSTRLNASAMMGFMCLARYNGQGEEAREFIERLNSGANLAEDDPILVLRQNVWRLRESRAMAVEYLALLIRVYNKSVRGETLTRLPNNHKNINPFPKLIGAKS